MATIASKEFLLQLVSLYITKCRSTFPKTIKNTYILNNKNTFYLQAGNKMFKKICAFHKLLMIRVVYGNLINGCCWGDVLSCFQCIFVVYLTDSVLLGKRFWHYFGSCMKIKRLKFPPFLVCLSSEKIKMVKVISTTRIRRYPHGTAFHSVNKKHN